MRARAAMQTASGGENRGREVRGSSASCRGPRWVWERLRCLVTRGWLLVISLLGIGMLPCPDCGGHLIVHYWPIAGLVLAVQTLRRRRSSRTSRKDETGSELVCGVTCRDG